MQEYEPLAQVIDNVVDGLQNTNLHTDITVSTHDEFIDETMQIQHPGKYRDRE